MSNEDWITLIQPLTGSSADGSNADGSIESRRIMCILPTDNLDDGYVQRTSRRKSESNTTYELMLSAREYIILQELCTDVSSLVNNKEPIFSLGGRLMSPRVSFKNVLKEVPEVGSNSKIVKLCIDWHNTFRSFIRPRRK